MVGGYCPPSLLQARDLTLRTASYLTLWYAAMRAYLKLPLSLIIHFPTPLQTRLSHQYLRATHGGVEHLIDTLQNASDDIIICFKTP